MLTAAALALAYLDWSRPTGSGRYARGMSELLVPHRPRAVTAKLLKKKLAQRANRIPCVFVPVLGDDFSFHLLCERLGSLLLRVPEWGRVHGWIGSWPGATSLRSR